MNKKTKVGMVTIGQSPRMDVVPQIKELAGIEAEYLECGALDGLSLSEVEKLAPEGGDKLWRIVLIHPPGFSLPAMGCVGVDCFSGRWALLDLPLDKDGTGLLEGDPVFLPEDFSVEDLRVVGRDGVQLNPVFSGETFFHTFAVNNLVTVPEPGFLLLLASGCLGLAVLNRLERR